MLSYEVSLGSQKQLSCNDIFLAGVTYYGDLDGCRATDNPPSTIPQNILTTSAGPDIVFVGDNKEVFTLELTVH